MDHLLGGVNGSMWHKWPEAGQRLVIERENVHTFPGGNGLNVAVGLAALDCKTRLHTGFARDGVGTSLEALLGKRGVDVQKARPKHPMAIESSQSYIITLNPSSSTDSHTLSAGEASYVHFVGASKDIAPESIQTGVDGGFLEGAKFLLVVGIGLMPNLDSRLDELEGLLTDTSTKGITTLLDLNLLDEESLRFNQDSFLNSVWSVIPRFTFIVPNVDEAEMLVARKATVSTRGVVTREGQWDRAEKYARELRRRGAQHVIIKCGEFGCLYLDKSERATAVLEVGVEWSDVTDTIGAGDAWVAGFVASLQKSGKAHPWDADTVRTACEFGNGVAALAIKGRGGTGWTNSSYT